MYSNGHVDGQVFCLNMDNVGSVKVLDEASSSGLGPCHLEVKYESDGDTCGLIIAHVSLVSFYFHPHSVGFQFSFHTFIISSVAFLSCELARHG